MCVCVLMNIGNVFFLISARTHSSGIRVCSHLTRVSSPLTAPAAQADRRPQPEHHRRRKAGLSVCQQVEMREPCGGSRSSGGDSHNAALNTRRRPSSDKNTAVWGAEVKTISSGRTAGGAGGDSSEREKAAPVSCLRFFCSETVIDPVTFVTALP